MEQLKEFQPDGPPIRRLWRAASGRQSGLRLAQAKSQFRKLEMRSKGDIPVFSFFNFS